MKPTPGAILDARYEIKGELGSGGMGTVYSAHDIELNRDVAIKILHKDSSDDSDLLKRFEREAKALSLLEHKNILTVYALGNWRGVPYLVMELLEGESLAALIARKGRLAGGEALQILSDVATAMMVAHSNGIVHRDLKPQNIFLAKIGNENIVKVIDFGLCRPIQNEADLQRLTTTGLLIGSVDYMSPESCQGQPSTAKSDIYSLGIVLYQSLTGQLPFDADNPMGVLYQHANNNPPVLSKRFPDLANAGAFDVILGRCLAKKPGNRFKSMDEFKAAMLELREQIGNSPSDEKTPEVNKGSIAAFSTKIFATVLLCVCIFAFWYFKVNMRSTKSTHSEAINSTQREQARVRHPAISSKVGRQNNDPVSLITIALRDRKTANDLLKKVEWEKAPSKSIIKEIYQIIDESIAADEKAIAALKSKPVKYLLFLAEIGRARSLDLSIRTLLAENEGKVNPKISKRILELSHSELDCLENAKKYVAPGSAEELYVYHDLGYFYANFSNPLHDSKKAEQALLMALKGDEGGQEYSPEASEYVKDDLVEETNTRWLDRTYYVLAKLKISDHELDAAEKYFDAFFKHIRESHSRVGNTHGEWTDRVKEYVVLLCNNKHKEKAQEILAWMENLPLDKADSKQDEATMCQQISEAFAYAGNKDKALEYANRSQKLLSQK